MCGKMQDIIALLLVVSVCALFFAFGMLAESGSGKAKEYCASIGMFADNIHGEWVCIDRPEWKRVPK